MESLHDVFFEEAAELLADMEKAFLSLERAPGDEELLNTIFRCVHSIKGAASMFGFAELSRFVHEFESVLDLLRHRQVGATPPMIDLLLRASDMLKSLLNHLRGEGSVDAASRAAIAAELQAVMAGQPPGSGPFEAAASELQHQPGPSNAHRYEIVFKPSPESFQRGIDPLAILERLPRVGDVRSVRLDLSALPPLASLNPEQCYLAWTIELWTSEEAELVAALFEEAQAGGVVRIAEIGQATPPSAAADDVPRLGEILLREHGVSAQALDGALHSQKKIGELLVEQGVLSRAQLDQALETQQRLRRKQEATSIRVNIDKVDALINLVGELVITQSMVAELIAGFTPERLPQLEAAVTQMDRHARELQERVMAIRMLPIRTLFSRFPRVVRDLAQAQGKQVVLETSGEETELDKTVIEQIGDPLTHLVRNAVDHGIEPPAVRRQAGKPEAGRLSLRAYQQSGNIYIEVGDDGRGLDRDRIIAKAVQHGLASVEHALTDEEVFALIFRPGFSTAEQVSEVSGRGVGMDVVKRNVESLNGSITVQSQRGRGTTFKIKLPLTLAILDGQLLQVGEQRYVLPLASIVESVRPRRESVNRVFGEAETVAIRGQVLPLLRLHRLFGLTPRTADPTQGLVVIVEHDGHHMALFVDDLLGQQQVVIKSLEANFRKVDGIAGATILGDGNVALILDVAGLLSLSRHAQADSLRRTIGIG
jgi:two-component system chemotaxis sensor kinase CheA